MSTPAPSVVPHSEDRRLPLWAIAAVVVGISAVLIVGVDFVPPSSYSITLNGMSITAAGTAAVNTIGYPTSGNDYASLSAGTTTVLGFGVAEVSYSYSDLGQFEITGVNASSSGAFQVIQVMVAPWPDGAAAPTGTPQPLPFFLPFHNQTTGYGATAQIWVTVRAIDQGPSDQTLYLTVVVNQVHGLS
ncbi:MAG: hypothetical protein ACLPWO_05870 [Thermoplasmata archaeon]